MAPRLSVWSNCQQISPTSQKKNFIQHLSPGSQSSLWSRESLPRSEHPAYLAISLLYPKEDTAALCVGFRPHNYLHVLAGKSPWLHPSVPKYHTDSSGNTSPPLLPNKPGSQFSPRHVRNSVSWTFCPVDSSPSHPSLLCSYLRTLDKGKVLEIHASDSLCQWCHAARTAPLPGLPCSHLEGTIIPRSKKALHSQVLASLPPPYHAPLHALQLDASAAQTPHARSLLLQDFLQVISWPPHVSLSLSSYSGSPACLLLLQVISPTPGNLPSLKRRLESVLPVQQQGKLPSARRYSPPPMPSPPEPSPQ